MNNNRLLFQNSTKKRKRERREGERKKERALRVLFLF